ncbi:MULTISPECIES: SRPBCC family protein [Mycobacteriaceae]|uniref:SRPBCC family protein n=1 Tax=Mycobacteriaceae TaxID=1762 RepID=UPI0007FD2E79|nr:MULTISPECIES: SRPBCC family protein [Mycobacteriaceae]MCK0174124.1 SRPBCC family protein [Mycolicibacterium sp. F2034L]OBB62036.1 cyclase [Mycobacterium sp. 852013-51886_SCH5428379]
MHAEVTVTMNAPAERIWDLIADVRNTGKFSPEVMEAEWLDGATGPSLGARFRGHVKRNEIGPVYWTTCRVTACEPGREFGFAVLIGDRAVNNWHYRLDPTGSGTAVTESFHLTEGLLSTVFGIFGGQLRTRRNKRDMRKTLERIKAVVESGEAARG